LYPNPKRDKGVIEVVGHGVILAIGLIQLILQGIGTVLALFIATEGKAKAGYFLAGGMAFFAVHNLLELLTEEENLLVASTKLIATIFLLYAVWVIYQSVVKTKG
jgi:hypothetical protein